MLRLRPLISATPGFFPPSNHPTRTGYPDKTPALSSPACTLEAPANLRAVRPRVCLDIAQPRRGTLSSGKRELGGSSGKPRLSFIDNLIDENRDLWDRLINHPFCSRMGDGTARVDGFKDYSISEFIFLRNYVRYKLGLYSKTDDWDILSTEAPASLARNISSANLQLQVCVRDLRIPQDIVLRAEPNAKVKVYIDWVKSSVQTEDWFSLHVLKTPCALGYFDIATKLINNPATKRDTLFYKLWIEPNARAPGVAESARKYRAWFDANMNNKPAGPSDLKHWRYLFRKACEMEISFFDSGL